MRLDRNKILVVVIILGIYSLTLSNPIQEQPQPIGKINRIKTYVRFLSDQNLINV